MVIMYKISTPYAHDVATDKRTTKFLYYSLKLFKRINKMQIINRLHLFMISSESIPMISEHLNLEVWYEILFKNATVSKESGYKALIWNFQLPTQAWSLIRPKKRIRTPMDYAIFLPENMELQEQRDPR